MLSVNIDKLHAVANALLERETLDTEEFEEVFRQGGQEGASAPA